MKGILFKPEMHQAIREGKKTVTRRIMKPQPHIERGVMRWQPRKGIDINIDDHSDLAIPYARYQVGEVVYIKEAYCLECYGDCFPCYKPEDEDCDFVYWHCPLMMPEKYARAFIQILDVRPERLQEITEEEAIKEGCRLIARTIQAFELKPYPHYTEPERPFTYRDHFIGLWDAINGEGDFTLNKWVFRYEFKLVKR